MHVIIIEKGKRRRIDVRQGEVCVCYFEFRFNFNLSSSQVFLLPSRIPHSPQRPEADSLGLVVERRRYDGEVDGLRWFTDFETCDKILYEKYFQCFDLGRDLVPVVKEYLASPEKASMTPSPNSVVAQPPFATDTTTALPAPFALADWLDAHADELERGAVLNLFDGHPDREICVRVCGGGGTRQTPAVWQYETLLYQLRGSARVAVAPPSSTNSDIGVDVGALEWRELREGECGVVPARCAFAVERAAGSVGFWITQDPLGNKE